MSTSDINRRKSIAKTGYIYLLISLFCILFGAVYEVFSHEVYSYFMLYAFVFPLAGGTLLFWGMFFCKIPIPNRVSLNLYHSGIATLTTGCLFQGALEIYGTTNQLVLVYWIVGILLISTAIFIYLLFQENKYRKINNVDLDL